MACATMANLQNLYNLPNDFESHLYHLHLRYLVLQILATGCFPRNPQRDSLAGGLWEVSLRGDPTTSFLQR